MQSSKFRFTSRRLALGGLALGLASSSLGCASAKLVNLWKDPEYPKAPLQNLLVVAVRKEPAKRRLYEDALVAGFRDKGIAATPSYRQFREVLPDTNMMREAVRARGYDGVVVTTKLPTETNTRFVPGYVTTVPVTRHDPWTGYYHTHWARVQHPGYVERERVVRYQVDVWSTEQGGSMVWTGTTESFDPSSTAEVTRHVGSLVVPELVKQGIVAAAK